MQKVLDRLAHEPVVVRAFIVAVFDLLAALGVIHNVGASDTVNALALGGLNLWVVSTARGMVTPVKRTPTRRTTTRRRGRRK